MTVESNYSITIATLSDWPVFQPMKSKTNRTLYTQFAVIAKNSDWLIALFTPVGIGQSNFFGVMTQISQNVRYGLMTTRQVNLATLLVLVISLQNLTLISLLIIIFE